MTGFQTEHWLPSGRSPPPRNKCSRFPRLWTGAVRWAISYRKIGRQFAVVPPARGAKPSSRRFQVSPLRRRIGQERQELGRDDVVPREAPRTNHPHV